MFFINLSSVFPEILVLIAYVLSPSLNIHAQLTRGVMTPGGGGGGVL